MKRIPLYTNNGLPPKAVVETVESLAVDHACTRCALSSKGCKTVCINAEGEPGGLLIVGEAPGRDDDRLGRPFMGKAGAILRPYLQRWWKGPVAFDSAVRCYPKGSELKATHIAKCRPYLAATIAEVEPTRILALGSMAVFSIFGRKMAPLTSRRAYSYMEGDQVRGPIPVFALIHPTAAARNFFIRQWFEADLKWALTAPAPPYGPWTDDARVIEDADDADEAGCELAEAGMFSFDVETCGRMWTEEFRIIAVACCARGSNSPWVWDRAALEDPHRRDVLLQLLLDKRIMKAGANVKYDQLSFRAEFGVVARNVSRDIRLQRKLLEPEASAALDAMAELVGMGGLKADTKAMMSKMSSKVSHALNKLPKDGGAALENLELEPFVENALKAGSDPDFFKYAMLPKVDLLRYNARDSVATSRCLDLFDAQLAKEPELTRTWNTIVLPAATALERVEAWGVSANRQAIERFDFYLGQREDALKAKLDHYAASYMPGINWNSVPQLRELLFKKLGLPSVKLSDGGGDSTDGEVLTQLAQSHPLPRDLLEYRTVTKLRGTYAAGMLPHVRDDGRIHPNIKLDGARSGRTSCVDPNLQNIPRAADSPEGKMARDCFVAPPGFRLLQLDYSQLELRIAAALSGDKKMIEIFKSGVDYHKRTAQLISKVAWGIEPHEVEKKHRSFAKTINFGLLYGKGDKTIAEEFGITQAAAARMRAAILGQFKDLAAWCEEVVRFTKKTGEAWTWWDGARARRRPMWRVADREDDFVRSVAEHGAINTPIQGTASDFCIASLAECVSWIEGEGLENDVKLVLAVHDSLMFEVREGMVNEVFQTVRGIMESWPSNGVPIVADSDIGDAWGSMEPIMELKVGYAPTALYRSDGKVCRAVEHSGFDLQHPTDNDPHWRFMNGDIADVKNAA